MWDMVDTLRLIQDFRSMPCLWDISSMDYKNRTKKIEAYNILATKYDVSSSEVEKKVQSLKSQFRREARKIMEGESNASSHSSVRNQCHWFGYKPLMFLLKGIEEAQNKSLDGSVIKLESLDGYVEIEDTYDGNLDQNEQEYERDDLSPSPPPQKKQKIMIRNAETKDESHCMKKLIDMVTKRDEFSVYGEHIANKLRNSNRNNFEICIAQHHMGNILFKLLMGAYSQEDSSEAGPVGSTNSNRK